MTVRRVAAFDFDGTITRRDTFVPFLRRVAGLRMFLAAVTLNVPRLLRAAVDDGARDAAKAAMIRRLLRDRRDVDVRALGERYAHEIVSTPNMTREDTRARMQWHLVEGHEVVIISASPTIYLDAVGRLLGAAAVLSTTLAVDPDGHLTGELSGANVRRAEKVRRLEAWLDGDDAEIWAYGDSIGDRELLARADHPTRI